MFRSLGWERQEDGWTHLEHTVAPVDAKVWHEMSAALQGLHRALKEGEALGPFARLARPQGRINRHLATALLMQIHALRQMEASLPPFARRRLGWTHDLDAWEEQTRKVLEINAVGAEASTGCGADCSAISKPSTTTWRAS